MLQESRGKDKRLYKYRRRSVKMFWDKKPANEESKKDRLSGPQAIPGLVQKHLVAEWKMAPDLVQLLKTVARKNPNGGKSFNIRIFDESEALAKKVQVKDYTSLDAHPDLIIYEGQFDEGSKQVKLEEKKNITWDTPIFTEAEIQQKIEALSDPGSSVFFYMARGTAHGGPLGMGAAVVELNPSSGKKQKKYIVYPVDVIDTQPAGREEKLFDSDKAKDIARWIKNGHHKRLY
jgi:hypothetical protein